MQLIRNKLAWMVAASGAYSFILLFRWKFTGLTPAKTFGRVWQYYVSWFDFGFHRRGIVGTILTESGVNRLAQNEYQFAYIFYSCLLCLCYVLVVWVILRHPRLRENDALSCCVILSPALFSHFTYGTGNLDAMLFVVLMLALFYVRNLWVFSLLLVFGIFVHELFFFLLPGIFLLKFITQPGVAPRLNKELVIPAVIAAVGLAVIMLMGSLNVDEATFHAVMAKRIPIAAQQIPLALGYFEVSSHIDHNYGYGIGALWAMRTYTFLPTLYAVALAYSAARYLQSALWLKLLLFAAILFPLFATPIASDYYRWVSLSAIMGLVSVMLLHSANKLTLPKHILIFLMLFSILSPFGPDVLRRPFPIHQTLLEKFAH